MNKSEQLAKQVIQELARIGVQEFCVCPGARNSALFLALMQSNPLKKHYWFEERSGAFFALGRCRESKRPVAIVTTSGTAVGEVLPAAMEAHYNHAPLVLLTADRPPRFRKSGAPQAAEQVGIFSHYAEFCLDLNEGDTCSLEAWDQQGPAHLNVCLEDPISGLGAPDANVKPKTLNLEQFLQQVQKPLVVVGGLHSDHQSKVANFLVSYKAPVFLEGISGLREDPRISHLRITRSEKIWKHAENIGHAIDGVLRIGGVPTFRLWRDLEDRQGQVAVCCVTETSFSGLSWGKEPDSFSHSHFELENINSALNRSAEAWLEIDRTYNQKLEQLFYEEPLAEPSLFHHLSKVIPQRSHIYLGNSLPIREWDLAATKENREYRVTASRGVNGIDGQISTFLGLSRPENDNWAILGDLTTLYDMAGPWILQQMQDFTVTIVVVNNSGGQIFARLFPYKEFLHSHQLTFKPLADMWGLHYERWEKIPHYVGSHRARLIEVVPDAEATKRFWNKYELL